MNWLLWREYRLCRLILIVGVFLLVIPYVIALVALLWPSEFIVREQQISRAVGVSAFYSVMMSQLTLVLLGGYAMAGERADRSAQFMAYVPVHRARRVICKLTLAICAFALIWAVNLTTLSIFSNMIDPIRMGRNDGEEFVRVLSCTSITGLVFYCVGWLISSFQSSPTFAVAGGLITPLIVLMGLTSADWLMDMRPSDEDVFFAYTGICVTLSVVCFIIGTLYYLKRVEP